MWRRIRQLLCAFTPRHAVLDLPWWWPSAWRVGHELTWTTRGRHVCLSCICGYETAGWTLGVSPPPTTRARLAAEPEGSWMLRHPQTLRGLR